MIHSFQNHQIHSIHLALGKCHRWTAEPSEPAEHIFYYIIVSRIIGCKCLFTEIKVDDFVRLVTWLNHIHVKISKTKQTQAKISIKISWWKVYAPIYLLQVRISRQYAPFYFSTKILTLLWCARYCAYVTELKSLWYLNGLSLVGSKF